MKYLSLYFFLFFAFASQLTGNAQQIDSMMNAYAEGFPRERIHLHFDKTAYNKEETIWYKAYIMDDQGLTQLSKNLYVEWYDTSGKMIRQTAAPLFQSTAKGAFELPADYKGNFIRVKAYTQWSLNDDPAFRFTRDIVINNTDEIDINKLNLLKTTL